MIPVCIISTLEGITEEESLSFSSELRLREVSICLRSPGLSSEPTCLPLQLAVGMGAFSLISSFRGNHVPASHWNYYQPLLL